MKRFHAHISVENLQTSIEFYSQLFGQAPSKRESDYAKWMLEDPRLNFAISARGHALGLNHFGFQVDSAEELSELKLRAEAASHGAVLNSGATTCCYAQSEKHWAIDPQGLAWEHYLTLADVVEFGQDTANQTGACCTPQRDAGCCVPSQTTASGCCV